MQKAVDFYTTVLGLVPVNNSPYWTDFQLGEMRIGLHPGKCPDHPSGWFLGLASDDLKSLKDAVQGSNGSVRDDYHETPAGVVLTIADPDGNPIQVMQVGSVLADFV